MGDSFRVESLTKIFGGALELLPAFAFILITIIIISGMERFFRTRPVLARRFAFLRGLLVITAITGGVIGAVIELPVEGDTREQLITLLAVAISAILTLSSTTFVGNTLAGLLLRAIRHYRPGDFIRVADHFGRVSEEGVFHTEIQTADGNLISLPNLYLVTEPVTVIRATGTIISAEVSLGYDVPHTMVERALAMAADATGLKDPFVQITTLGDYSAVYRCAGLLENVETYFGATALLRANMLDLLHEHGIEIVSPAFMTRRTMAPDDFVIPDPPSYRHAIDSAVATGPRASVVFDKAERAAALEKLKNRIDELTKETAEKEKKLASAKQDFAKRKIESDIERNQAYLQYLKRRLTTAEESVAEE